MIFKFLKQLLKSNDDICVVKPLTAEEIESKKRKERNKRYRKERRELEAYHKLSELRKKKQPTLQNIVDRNFQVKINDHVRVGKVGNDAALNQYTKDSITDAKGIGLKKDIISPIQANWFASQGFIGHTLCAILAQHWLILKACQQPAEDSLRNGFEILRSDGEELAKEHKNQILKLNDQYRLYDNLSKAIVKNRIFGVRLILFKVSTDNQKEYYENPFNIDGVTAGSYQGMVQIDPNFVTPIVQGTDSFNAASDSFYEPTYWYLNNGWKIHKSHFVILRNSEVADILKPTYLYGGIPLPQQIYNRVYAAERIADEAPALCLTKRLKIQKVDMDKVVLNPGLFAQRQEVAEIFQDNYATKFIGLEEEVTQTDTSLSDLDAVLMNSFQLVAAVAKVPATKLLGTSPKGFNSSGTYEETSYSQELETIQNKYILPILVKHHQLMMKSDIVPTFILDLPFDLTFEFNEVNVISYDEESQVQQRQAQNDVAWCGVGAISPKVIAKRLARDPKSGYMGLIDEKDLEDIEDYNTTEDDAGEQIANEEDSTPFEI